MRFSKAVVKYRIPILILTVLLMIPAVIGIANTRINYDMLNYLPEDMDTIIGQDELMEDFGKGAFSFIIVEDMPNKDVAALKAKIEQVDHVDTVIWYDTLFDLSVPMELLPDKIYTEFNTDHSTMMAVFFDSSTSADITMDAIREIRALCGKQCYVSGMSALVTDLKDLCEQEEPIYVGIAVALACGAMLLFLDSWLVPFVFLASIGMMILLNLGSNIFMGEISYITKALSAVLQLAVTMDYSIFLWESYNEQRGQGGSGGDYIGFGPIERYDCLDWINWVIDRCGNEIPIYLGGVSMGATTVLMAAGLELPDNVHGIVGDCGFTSPHAIWKHVANKNLHIAFGLRGAVADTLYEKITQTDDADYSTVDALRNCSVPIMLIHGTDDHFVPVEMTYENYKACTSPKKLFIVPGADHGMSYYIDKEGYEAVIKDFWRRFD